MAKKNKLSMPSSSGGLIRYFDEYEDSFQLHPKWIVSGIVGIIAIELLLHTYGALYLL